MKLANRILAFSLCVVTCISTISSGFVAKATVADAFYYGTDSFAKWLLTDEPWGGWTLTGWADALFASNKEQKYYTTPTETVEDQYGNVTNFYRGGDTTTTKIIDSYNHTFNTIHNTTNNTNNYSANVKLSDFLNTYTTNNNDYTYNTTYKSWYYDNDTNNYTYSDNDTYYSEDNRQYYITIDNSTDEYYMIDVQYSPTFVTVTYDYSTTNIDNSIHYGDVTNVYYFELTDGRNSSTLSASEVAGLDLGYDVANYELVPEYSGVLSLQHFDGNYDDSSTYGRSFYSENRSTTYADSGAFGGAVQLPSGAAAGVTIPGLSDYDNLMFDFRVRYSDIDDLSIYLGDINIFSSLPAFRSHSGWFPYTDYGSGYCIGRYCSSHYGVTLPDVIANCPGNGPCFHALYVNHPASIDLLDLGYVPSTEYRSSPYVPSFSDDSWPVTFDSTYGCFVRWSQPVLHASSENLSCYEISTANSQSVTIDGLLHESTEYYCWVDHFTSYSYRAYPVCVSADFSYGNYVNQWISMRVVISGGNLYYFVNGDLVGSGAFDKPAFDKFYIKSSGTLYLDELRICTGDLVSADVYTPSSAPFDSNMVLALPDDLTANTIYVKHSTPVSAHRIGGVRPSAPTTGFFYIPLHDDYTGGQPQIYDGSNWVNVEAMVYNGTTVSSALGYVFSPVGASPDVDQDLQPGRPGDSTDSDSCVHSWVETKRKDPTCTVSGSVSYSCSLCGSTKSETLDKTGHKWVLDSSVDPTYDDSGNVVTQGYSLYKCSVCGEDYKDLDGSGPPVDSSGSSDGGNWFTNLLGKIGEFFGTTIGGLLELVGNVLGGIFDSLIDLVKGAIEKIGSLVDLSGTFGESLGSLWGWLPSEIVTVMVAGVTLVVLVAVVKIFL